MMRPDDNLGRVPSKQDEQRPLRPLFHLGRTVATPAALRVLVAAAVDPMSLLQRHQRGDFGALDDEDVESNLEAIRTGARLLSSYLVGVDRVWVITEAKDDRGIRFSTCLLLPEEY